MALTVQEIARRVGGRVEGDGSVEIRAVAGIREAQAGDITFLDTPRYARWLERSEASAALVAEDWQGKTGAVIIRVPHPGAAFTQVVMGFMRPPPRFPPGVHPSAVVAPNAVLGQDVYVGPACVIEPGVQVGNRTVLVAACYLGHETSVGADCLFYPAVTVREHTRIGSRVILHSGAAIGSDGFGYEREHGRWKKIP